MECLEKTRCDKISHCSCVLVKPWKFYVPWRCRTEILLVDSSVQYMVFFLGSLLPNNLTEKRNVYQQQFLMFWEDRNTEYPHRPHTIYSIIFIIKFTLNIFRKYSVCCELLLVFTFTRICNRRVNLFQMSKKLMEFFSHLKYCRKISEL